MITLLTLVASVVLIALASADLWVSGISKDELSEMGLEP